MKNTNASANGMKPFGRAVDVEQTTHRYREQRPRHEERDQRRDDIFATMYWLVEIGRLSTNSATFSFRSLTTIAHHQRACSE